MHLADILPRLEIIAVQIAAVHPVRHPDHVVVPVHGQSAHLDLPRFGVPVDRTLPFQVVRIVNGDLNVLALAVFESLDTGIQLAVPHVDIAQVIGFERQSFERVFVFGDQPPLLVVLVEHRAARNIIVVRVSGDPLPAFDRENPRQAVLPSQCLRPECGSGRQQEQYKKSSFHRYLQYYLAIIYLIRPASRPGFSFPTLRPWISVLQILRPGFTPGFVPRQLSCPLPGRARNSVPPRGNFGLAARIFSSPAARPGNCCAAPRLRPRPDPSRSASPRGLLPRRPATPEKAAAA